MLYRILIEREEEGQWVAELDHRRFNCLKEVEQVMAQLKLEQTIARVQLLVEKLAY